MNNLPTKLGSTKDILSLTLTEQIYIKGGMAATEEEKRKKIKKHH